jgi:hypothetical protein
MKDPRQPICAYEGCNAGCHSTGTDKLGRKKYRAVCSWHHDLAGRKRGEYRRGKKTHCENYDSFLGFPCPTNNAELVSVMLAVDHYNGDRDDNSMSNLKTWCRCCDGLKTKLFRDNRPRYDRGFGYSGATLDLICGVDNENSNP